MGKKIVLLVVLITTISLIFIFKENLTSYTIENYYTYTKAICNKTNYCQDYEIICKGKKVIDIRPISGAVVQFPQDWEDPRDKDTRNRLCE